MHLFQGKCILHTPDRIADLRSPVKTVAFRCKGAEHVDYDAQAFRFLRAFYQFQDLYLHMQHLSSYYFSQ